MNANHPAVGSPVGSAVGYWKFDEGYGTTANNLGSCGSPCNGTLTSMDSPATYGSGWTDKGKFEKALNFDGANDYVDMGNPTAVQTTSDLTLSSWVYLSSNADNQDIIAKRGLSSQWGYRLWVDSSGIPKIDVSSTGNVMATASASQTLSNNQWYHLVGTYSASQSAITIYVNGVQKGQTTSSVPHVLQNSTANLNVGREAGGVTPNYVKGSLDEVKLYNYALSADEVKVDYNQGKAIVLGSLSTDPDGVTATNSASRAYCVPGDTTTCNPPVAHWPLDERTGTTANDITGNANTGTLTNGPRWTTGKVSQALQFDGADDYVDVGDKDAYSVNTTNQLTVSAWIYRNRTDVTEEPISKGDSPNNYEWGIRARNDGYYRVVLYNPDGSTNYLFATDTQPVAAHEWHQIVMVADLSAHSLQMYRDGVLQATDTANSGSPPSNGTAAMRLGLRADGASPFDGKIDDVRVYNYARTPAQIAWDYNKGGPVGLWKFDECTGTTAYDLSGKGNNGTITIGVTGSQTTAGNCVTVDTAAAWYNGRNGIYNSSLNFDGTDDSVIITDNDTLDPGTNDWSISLWYKAADITTLQRLVSKGFPYAGLGFPGYSLMYNASLAGKPLLFQLNDGTNWNDFNSAAVGDLSDRWHHIPTVSPLFDPGYIP
jgi:hypothetical protein